jgi:hypothetical protein
MAFRGAILAFVEAVHLRKVDSDAFQPEGIELNAKVDLLISSEDCGEADAL